MKPVAGNVRITSNTSMDPNVVHLVFKWYSLSTYEQYDPVQAASPQDVFIANHKVFMTEDNFTGTPRPLAPSRQTPDKDKSNIFATMKTGSTSCPKPVFKSLPSNLSFFLFRMVFSLPITLAYKLHQPHRHPHHENRSDKEDIRYYHKQLGIIPILF